MATISFLGNLGRDPESVETKKGTAMAKLLVIENEGWGDSKYAKFWNVVAYGKKAEFCLNNLAKGRKVAVVGEIKHRKYNEKEYADVEVYKVDFADSKKDTAESPF